MVEITNPLSRIKMDFESTTSQKPPFVIHSGTEGNFPDGTPYTDTRYRKSFFSGMKITMGFAINRGFVTDSNKIEIYENFRLHWDEIIKRPYDLENTLGGYKYSVLRITEEDVAWATQQIVQFLAGTGYDIEEKTSK